MSSTSCSSGENRKAHFRMENASDVNVEMTTLLDDGAIVYVNGSEVLRLGLPSGDIGFDRRANRGVGNAQLEGTFSIPSCLASAMAPSCAQIHSSTLFFTRFPSRSRATDATSSSFTHIVDQERHIEKGVCIFPILYFSINTLLIKIK